MSANMHAINTLTMHGLVLTVWCCCYRVGRKFLLIQGGIQMTICQIVTAVILATQMDKATGTMPPAAGKAVLAFICLFVAGKLSGSCLACFGLVLLPDLSPAWHLLIDMSPPAWMLPACTCYLTCHLLLGCYLHACTYTDNIDMPSSHPHYIVLAGFGKSWACSLSSDSEMRTVLHCIITNRTSACTSRYMLAKYCILTHFCSSYRFLMVLGSSGVVGALRGAHHRDPLPCSGYHRVYQLPGQLPGGTSLLDHAVPPGVGHLHLLCLLGCPHEPVRHLLLARDQGGASRGDAGAVEPALVLGQLCQELWHRRQCWWCRCQPGIRTRHEDCQPVNLVSSGVAC